MSRKAPINFLTVDPTAAEPVYEQIARQIRADIASGKLRPGAPLPPCGLRQGAGARPICPEGRRYCGERVWTFSLDEYRRVI